MKRPKDKYLTRIKSLENDLRDLKSQNKSLAQSAKPIIDRPSIKYRGKELILRKTVISPKFERKTVLTDSHWHYIELLLKSGNGKKYKDAINYWNQAKNFYLATKSLDVEAKPLTTYYCFLNATKALLTYKEISFDTKHGVSGEYEEGQIKLQNEIVKIQKNGVIVGLINYLEEDLNPTTHQAKIFNNKEKHKFEKEIFNKTKKFILPQDQSIFRGVLDTYLSNLVRTQPSPLATYTLKDILYNLEYIHRAFNLTFNHRELFIPILKPRFVFDKNANESWLEFSLEPEHSNKRTLNAMSTLFKKDEYYKSSYSMRSIDSISWFNKTNNDDYDLFLSFYLRYRKHFTYIYSTNELWYFKRTDRQNTIDRNSLVLTLAAMHRLSEMARYDPNRLVEHLASHHGWLLSEFINKSLYQFVDMISTEISGEDFRATGFRD